MQGSIETGGQVAYGGIWCNCCEPKSNNSACNVNHLQSIIRKKLKTKWSSNRVMFTTTLNHQGAVC